MSLSEIQEFIISDSENEHSDIPLENNINYHESMNMLQSRIREVMQQITFLT